MSSMHTAAGLAGVALAIAAWLVVVPGIERLARPRLVLLTIAIFTAALLPLGELPAAAYVRSVAGDLSITTIVWLGYGLLRLWLGAPPLDAKSVVPFKALIALAAAALYPMALGIGRFDPYRLGFGDPWFVGGLLALALAAWWARLTGISVCISLAVLAWAVGWYESKNLWDYLLDPLVSLYALWAFALRGMQALRLPRDVPEEDRGLPRPVTPRS